MLIGVTLLTEFRTREPTRSAVETGMARNALAEASRRNAEVLQAMGMGARIGDALGPSQRQVHGLAAARLGRRRRPRRGLQGDAHGAAVGACSASAPIS